MQSDTPITGLFFPSPTIPVLSALAAHHHCQEMSLPYLPDGSLPALPERCMDVTWLEGLDYALMVPSGRKGCPAYGLRLKYGAATEVEWFVALLVEHRQSVSAPFIRTLRVQRPDLDNGPLMGDHVTLTISLPASTNSPSL